MKISVTKKLVTALILAVAVTAGGIGYVAIASVDALSLRLRSMHTESLLPLWDAVEAGDYMDAMHISTLHALFKNGEGQRHNLEDFASERSKFEESLANYQQVLTISSHLEMQSFLQKIGAFEDQNQREQNALGAIHQDYPSLLESLGRIRNLLQADKRPEAFELVPGRSRSGFWAN